MTEANAKPTETALRLLAESLIQEAHETNCFAVAITFDFERKELMMARSHHSDDFYETVAQLLELYRASERSGDVQHVSVSGYKN